MAENQEPGIGGEPEQDEGQEQVVDPYDYENENDTSEPEPSEGDDYWEQKAKEFQSQYDSEHAKVGELERYKQLGDLLQARPDLVKVLQDNLEGKQPEQPQSDSLKPDDFDPWEAYYNPESPSYKYRVQQEDQRIQSKIDSAVQTERQAVRLDQTKESLKRDYGMQDENVQEFVQWASQPVEALSMDSLVKVWAAEKDVELNKQSSPAQPSHRNPSASAVSARAEPTKKEADVIFDKLLKADQQGRI